MLNQVLKRSSGTCQQFVEDAVKTRLSQVRDQHIAGEVEISAMCTEKFSYESNGERILKIGRQLPKAGCLKIQSNKFPDTV